MMNEASFTAPRKKVLIIAYAFPPVGGIAAQRPLKFVRYLRDSGWEPVVLTTKDAYSATMDPSLLDELPEGVEVIRVPDPVSKLIGKMVGGTAGSPSPSSSSRGSDVPENAAAETRMVERPRLPLSTIQSSAKSSLKKWKGRLLIPDDQVLWAIKAAKIGRKVVLDQGISCVYTTSGPYSTHLAGWWIGRMTQAKWVADFRDPWVDNLHFEHTGQRRKLEQRMERAVFRQASHIITVTERFRDLFATRHPGYQDKISVIRNGVDPADFVQPHADVRKESGSQTFRFFYAGILYHRRSPERFFQALSMLLQRQFLLPSQVHVEFAGVFDYPGHADNANLVRTLNLEQVVTNLGYLPRAEVIKKMQAADALLLIGETGEKATQYVAGKLYEYLFAKRPVLALVEEGESAEILRETKTGIVVPPQDVTAIAEAIRKLVEKRDAGFDPQWHIISQYSRVTQTEQLANLLNQITTHDEVTGLNYGISQRNTSVDKFS